MFDRAEWFSTERDFELIAERHNARKTQQQKKTTAKRLK